MIVICGLQVRREAEAKRQQRAVGNPAALGHGLSAEETVSAAPHTHNRVDRDGAGLHRS